MATELEALLAKAPPIQLTKNDVKLVAGHVSSSNTDPKAHSLALAVLARSLSSSTPASSTVIGNIESVLSSLLAGTDTHELVKALSTLSAILQVSPSVAVDLLQRTCIQSNLIDLVESISSYKFSAVGKQDCEQELFALVELISLAAGQSRLRKLLRESAQTWLENLLNQADGRDKNTTDSRVAALAAVAIIKLHLGTESPEEGGTITPTAEKASQLKTDWTLEKLTKLVLDIFVRTCPSQTLGKEKDEFQLDLATEATILACLEGFAYLSLVPKNSIKPLIAAPNFLAPLFALLPNTKSNGALDYAVASLVHHLIKFPSAEASSDESAQVNRLKAFASAQTNRPKPEQETAETITLRIKSIIEGNSPLLMTRTLCRSTSLPTCRLTAQILHSLVTPTETRGKLLQAGVAIQLLALIRQLPQPFQAEQDTQPIQALAKLLITTNPALVFGTPDATLLLEASHGLTVPLQAGTEQVGLLCTFECLMALTNIAGLGGQITENLASLSPKTGTIGGGNGRLLKIAQELMLNLNPMIRRASSELICNLVASDAGIEFYHSSANSAPEGKLASSLHLLLALSSSPDLNTRLAASGALTSLVQSDVIASSIAKDGKGMQILVELVEDDHEGLRHRAYEVLRMIAVNTQKDAQAKQSLEDFHLKAVLEKAIGTEPVPELKEIAQQALTALTN